jgi:zinc transport system permease protein
VIPAAASLQLAKSFRQSLLLAAVIGAFSVLVGITAAFLLDIPAGATVVMVNFLVFLLAMAWRRLA